MSNGLRGSFDLQRENFRLQVEFNIPEQGITALFGASGAGKTTLLRCIAGLEHAPGGSLHINSSCWQDDSRNIFVPVHKRPVAVVFQDARLFPHLSVYKNLCYGMQRKSRHAGSGFYKRVIDLLELEQLLDRMPSGLSGGEQQRVAIARALLTSPRLLLMDEPLAALDTRRKAEIIPFIKNLQKELQIPITYVSHQIEEIQLLADHLLLLDQGRIKAAGPTNEILSRPDLSLSRADEGGVVLDGWISGFEKEYGLVRITTPIGPIWVSERHCPRTIAMESPIRLRIQARDVSLALQRAEQCSILNIIEAGIVEVRDIDHSVCIAHLQVDGQPLLARLTRKSCHDLGLTAGQPVFAQIKSIAID